MRISKFLYIALIFNGIHTGQQASAAEPLVNGCSPSAVTDLTGQNNVTITVNGIAYTPDCIQVDPGTTITVNASFANHPLVGGKVLSGIPTPDFISPIPSVNTGTTIAFQMPTQGLYGYYCNAHAASGMFGAILVGQETILSADFESPQPVPGGFVLTSSAFQNNGTLPVKYAAIREGGNNISPPVTWNNPPGTTAAYALVMDDGGFAPAFYIEHWGIYNIPSATTSLVEGVTPGSIGAIGVTYFGPSPPFGETHPYTFELFALNQALPANDVNGVYFTREAFKAQFTQYIIQSTTLTVNYTGTFQ